MREFKVVNKVGNELLFREWSHESASAVVCLVHGLGEHSGRYQHFADLMNRRGFAVLSFDQQGHGESTGKRGHTAGLESMLEDIQLLIDEAKRCYPHRSLFLYGHSMGGNEVLNFVLRRKPAIAGVIASAPWIVLSKPPSKLLIALARLLYRIFPSLTQSNRLDPNDLSDDENVLEALKNDPLAHDRISIRLAVDLTDGAEYVNTYSGPVSCPMLLMHGSNDHITSATGSQHLAGRVNGDVTMRLWQGMKHEIHNESQKEDVLEFAAEWMTLHIQSKK